MKRDLLINFRVSSKEKKIIEANAAKHDLSMSDYIRFVAMHTDKVEITITPRKKETKIIDFEKMFKE